MLFRSWYLHMKDISVNKGQPVGSNTCLGTIGDVGAEGNPHLHIEVQKPDRREPMVPSSAGLYLKGNYFGAYDLLDFIEAA